MALPIEARNHALTRIGTTLKGVAGLVEFAGILVKDRLGTAEKVHHVEDLAMEGAKKGVTRLTRRMRTPLAPQSPQK